MITFMNEAIQYLPEFATATGVAVGYAALFLTDLHAEKTETSIIDAYGPIEEMPSPGTVERSVGHRVVGVALKLTNAGVFGVAAGLLIPAFFANEAPQPLKKPTLELVVDRSGQTLVNGTAPKILSVAEAFKPDQKVNVNVIVARGGSFEEGNITPRSLENNNLYWPVGAVSLGETTNIAIGSAKKNDIPVSSNVIGASQVESGAILIDTADDSPGSVASVVNEAKQVNAKIYIANSGNQTDANAQELKAIAHETGGMYFNSSQNTKVVAQKIVNSITPPGSIAVVKNNNAWQNWLKVLDIGAAFASVGLLVKTAGLTFKRKRT